MERKSAEGCDNRSSGSAGNDSVPVFDQFNPFGFRAQDDGTVLELSNGVEAWSAEERWRAGR